MTSSQTNLNVAILGATGAAGRALLQALEDGDLPVAEVRLLATERSAGAELEFRGEPQRVRSVAKGAFAGCRVAFFAAGAAAARAWAADAWSAGCAVVDLSSAFRGDAGVPLVLPPLNGAAAAGFRTRGVVAIPGPAAAQLALALAPIHAAARIERAVVTSCEAVSGAGREAVDAFEAELRAMLSFQEPSPASVLPHRIAFNLVPQVGRFEAAGFTDDERSVAEEVGRLLSAPPPRLSVTSVRVPLFYGHTQLVTLRTAARLAAADARALLAGAPGVKVVDDPAAGIYPMPMLAVNDDAVLVGRVRDDPTEEHGLALVVAADNLRVGGASTAIAVGRSIADELARAP